MAEISPSAVETPYGVTIYKWAGVTESDTCTAVPVPHRPDKSVHVSDAGALTWGTGGEVTIEGSLDPDGGHYVTVSDVHDTALVLNSTTVNLRALQENAYLVRPSISAGTGVSLDILLMCK